MALALVLLATAAAAAETLLQDDTGRIVKRRRPGYAECVSGRGRARPSTFGRRSPPQEEPGSVRRRRVIERAPPAGRRFRAGLCDYVDSVPGARPLAHRRTLGYQERWFDPYNRNVLKGDLPVHGDDWFFNLGVISDTVYELREVPTPVGGISDRSARRDRCLRQRRPVGSRRPRGSSSSDQGRHGLQAARLRVPLHAGLQLQLRRARGRCAA